MRQIGVQHSKTRPLLQPVSRSTDFESAYSSMRNSKWCCFNIQFGVNAGTTVYMELMQAKNVAGASEKAMKMLQDFVYKCNSAATGEDADKWERATVTGSDTDAARVTVSAEDGYFYKIYVHNDWFDADNNFDCVAIRIFNLSSSLMAVSIEFEEPRFGGDPADVEWTPSNAVDAGDKYGNQYLGAESVRELRAVDAQQPRLNGFHNLLQIAFNQAAVI